MRDVNFDPAAWDDFQHWLETDREMVRRVVRLIAEIQRDPFNGIGKPEPLKETCPVTGRDASTTNTASSTEPTTKQVKILKARYHYTD